MRRWCAGVALAALAGCTVGPDYAPPGSTALGIPPAYSVPVSAPQATATDPRWWTGFGDPLLTSLVDRARAGNLDLAQATARLRQAREALVQSRAALLPNVNGTAGYSRFVPLIGENRVTLPDGTVTTIRREDNDSFSVGGSLAYQVGLFGEVRRTVEASGAQAEAAGFDRAAVLISIEGEVARNYLLARLYQAQLANARDSLALQDDNLEIAGFRVQAGLVSSLDSEQARVQRAQTAATIPQLEQSYVAAVGRLGVLLGEAPGAVRGEIEAVRPIPDGGAPGVGIPADVLRQRPDVRRAERQLAAATANIGVAAAQLYPALNISGQINTNAVTLGTLGDIVTGTLFAGLTQAIFDGGRRRAAVRANEAAAEGAFALYRQTVLTALEEVENAATQLRSAEARERFFAEALTAADNSALLARLQYRSGLTDFVTLNQQESALLSARNGLASARADRATALVQLHLALGGGWTAADTDLSED